MTKMNIPPQKLVLLISAAFLVLSCASQQKNPAQVLSQEPKSEKTLAVENNLLPPVMIKEQPIKNMNIQERMDFYHVPGVSIAVINNFSIESSNTNSYKYNIRAIKKQVA